MPTYRLDLLVDGKDEGASDVLISLHQHMGALTVAMGTLAADGIKALGGALFDLGKQGLSVATDYQSSLNMFQAVSGATGNQMALVAAEAKKLGGDMTLPATSAGDAARAMTELAKAGLTVTDALAAGKGTLQLAAAAHIDEAQAAEIAANALNSFGLSGDKAMQVADLFAAAANRSSVEVTDVADSFKMASAVFSAFQGPVVGSEHAMTDLTTAIALLGNVGIKGSDAGTSLKQMLLQLTGPSQVAKDAMKALMFAAQGATGGMDGLDTVLHGSAAKRAKALGAMAAGNPALANMGDIAYDASGKMRPLQEIIGLVSQATKGMSDEQRNAALTTIFGADATRAVIGLMRAGPDAFNQMSTAITQQGAAADLAGAQMKGLGGAWEGWQSTLETTLLTLTEPLLAPLEQGVRAAAAALSDATPGILAFVQGSVLPGINAVVAFGTAFLQAPDKVGFLVAAVQSAFSAVQAYVVAALPSWLASLEGWVWGAWQWAEQAAPLVLAALAVYGASVLGWATAQLPSWIATLATWAWEATQWIVGALPGVLAALTNYGDQIFGWAVAQLPGWIATLATWAHELWAWVGPALPGLLASLLDLRNQAVDWLLGQAPTLIDTLHTWSLALLDWVVAGLPPMLGALTTGTVALIGLIGEHLPGILNALGAWALALLQWVVDATPGLLRELGGAVGRLLDAIGAALPGIIESLGHWGAALFQWVIDAAPGLFWELLKLIGDLLVWVGDRVPGIAQQLATWAEAFLTWVGPAALKLTLALGGMVGDLLIWLAQQAPGFAEKLNGWIETAGQWIETQGLPLLLSAIGTLATGIWGKITELADQARGEGSIGAALIDGIRGGISAGWDGFTGWMSTQWDDFLRGVREVLGIHSPSTVFAEIGSFLIDGLYDGLMGGWGRVTGMAGDIGHAMETGLREWIGSMRDTGGYIIGGLWDGITARWGQLLQDFQNLVGLLPQGVRDVLGIHSPSRVFAMQVGQWIPAGIAAGALDAAPAAVSAVQGIANDLLPRTPLGPALTATGVSGAAATTTPGAGLGGGAPVTVIVQGSVLTERDLVDAVYEGLLERQRRQGSLGFTG